MTSKVIRSQEEYRSALSEISALIDRDPTPDGPEGERLNLLTVLVRDYESRTLSKVFVDPLEAIRFRMEQSGLRQRDLIPFIGSKSRVSEVMAGKRPLSLSMIRALHTGLGIPAESLLGSRDPALLAPSSFEWGKFPINEMIAYGWIKASAREVKTRGEELLRSFFAPLGNPEAVLARYRQTGHVRSGRKVDQWALTAWTAQVLRRAVLMDTPVRYVDGSITLDRMREIAKLSWSEQGPRLAQEYLRVHLGILVVVEPHLSHTHLDGAAIQGPKGPVIGLTIRHDRLDNFWFCLMHELVHVDKHLTADARRFCDDLDADAVEDAREREADAIAGEALIPSDTWVDSPAHSLHSAEAVQELANRLRIHPAIVAGRIRKESGRFKILSEFVGHGEVRRHFNDVRWE
jgi:HTH-type transcriptional regulator/antitoxin HigA